MDWERNTFTITGLIRSHNLWKCYQGVEQAIVCNQNSKFRHVTVSSPLP